MADSSEDWMQKRWRPAMGWTYMAVCLFDFIFKANETIPIIVSSIFFRFKYNFSVYGWCAFSDGYIRSQAHVD